MKISKSSHFIVIVYNNRVGENVHLGWFVSHPVVLVSVYANDHDLSIRAAGLEWHRNEGRKPLVCLLCKEVHGQRWMPVLPGINTSNLSKNKTIEAQRGCITSHSPKRWSWRGEGGAHRSSTLPGEFWGEPHTGSRPMLVCR